MKLHGNVITVEDNIDIQMPGEKFERHVEKQFLAGWQI